MLYAKPCKYSCSLIQCLYNSLRAVAAYVEPQTKGRVLHQARGQSLFAAVVVQELRV